MSSPRRILYVSHVDRIGGGERSLLDLLTVLDRDAFAPLVVVPTAGELSAALDELGVAWRANPHLRRMRRRSSLVHQAARLAAGRLRMKLLVIRERVDLIHANSTTAALFAMPGRLVGRVPLVWHLRDLVPLGRAGGWLCRRAARILCPSAAVSGLAAEMGGGARSVMIPNGIDTARFAGDVGGDPSERAAGEILAVTIGQLVPWKNHDLLVAAAAAIRQRRPDVHFLLIGDDRFGDDPAAEGRLRAMIEVRHLGAGFRLGGYRADIERVLAAASVVIHPAYPEPFGRVVVEAMAAGCPVVAFAGDHGPAEILRDGVDGVLVPEQTPEALAAGVLRVLADPNGARRMGAAGRVRAIESYDRRMMARRIEAVYREVLE